MRSCNNMRSVPAASLAVTIIVGSLLIGAHSFAAAPRSLPAPPSVTIAASGITLTAQPDGTIQVTDRSGTAKLVLGNYRLTWTPGRTEGGVSSLIVLPGGDKAIQIDYKVLDDPTGAVRIKGQFSFRAGHAHLRYDVWGPEDLKTGGAMLDCAAQPASSAVQVAKLGRWVRDAKGGVPYEVPDVNLIGFPLPGTVAYLSLHGNPDWRDAAKVHFPAVKTEPGHFVAEGDLTMTAARPAAAGAMLGGRPLSLCLWSDQPNNLWTTAERPLVLKTETVNILDSAKPVTLTWIARDYDGKVVATGSEQRRLGPKEVWDRPVSISAPTTGIVFVEVTASTGTDSVFSRTNLAVLPPHTFVADSESLFGLSAYFPLPTEADAEVLLSRIGVKWLRSTQLSAAQAMGLQIAQNSHISMPPSGKPDAFDADPSKKRAWVDEQLNQADQRGAHFLELFNEWNMDGGIGKAKWATMYADDWLAPVHAERERIHAKVKIMSMGLAGLDTAFLDQIHAAGKWSDFDALALHTGRGWYTADYGGKEQGQSSNTDYWNFLGSVEGANAILTRYGQKELWITEAYASTVPNNAWTDTDRHAAENVVLSYALAAANGVRVMDWYQLNDSVWYDQGGVNPTDPEYHFGLLQRDLSPKPSLLAYATIAAALDQAHFVRGLKFENGHTHGLLFDTPRGPMSVLWDRTDGYLLNTKRDPVTKSFATPEPWIDDWKTHVPLNLRATGATVREIDCISRQRDIPANHGTVAITLDGAPRIYYGLATDP